MKTTKNKYNKNLLLHTTQHWSLQIPFPAGFVRPAKILCYGCKTNPDNGGAV